LRRSRLKEKVDAGQRTLHHGISSRGLWPGELKITQLHVNLFNNKRWLK